MQKMIRPFLFALLLSVTAWDVSADPVEIHLGFIDRVNPPFVIDPGEVEGHAPGLTIELLRRVEQKLPVVFRYHSMPWARSLHLLQANELDAVFHASFKPERLKLGVYPMRKESVDQDRNLVTQAYYVYKREASLLNWDGEQFSDLDGPLGTIIGFSVNSDLAKAGYAVEATPTLRSNLDKLRSGRVAAVVNYASQTDTVLGRAAERYPDIVKLPIPFKVKYKYLLFSHGFYRQRPALTEAIWDELRALHESGEYAAIATRYSR